MLIRTIILNDNLGYFGTSFRLLVIAVKYHSKKYKPTLQEPSQVSHKEASFGKTSCVPVVEKQHKMTESQITFHQTLMWYIVGYICSFLKTCQ